MVQTLSVIKGNFFAIFVWFVLFWWGSFKLNDLLNNSQYDILTLGTLTGVLIEIMVFKGVLSQLTWRAMKGRNTTVRQIVFQMFTARFRVAGLRILGILSIYTIAIGVVVLVINYVSIFIANASHFAPLVLIPFWCIILFLAIRYYVAIPLTVIERLTVRQSIAASVNLSKNNRWMIFRLLLILNMVTALVVMLIIVVSVAIDNGGFDAEKFLQIYEKWGTHGTHGDILLAGMSSFLAILDGVATTVCYMHLRDNASPLCQDASEESDPV